jgi:cytochrome P450
MLPTEVPGPPEFSEPGGLLDLYGAVHVRSRISARVVLANRAGAYTQDARFMWPDKPHNPNTWFMWQREDAEGKRDHGRQRSVLAPSYSRQNAAAWAQKAEDTALALVHRAIQQGEIDLAADFGYPFALSMAAATLGISEDDARVIAWHVGEFVKRPVEEMADPLPVEIMLFLDELIRRRTEHPHRDLLDHLIAVSRNDGNAFGYDDLVSCIWGLVAAGVETTGTAVAGIPAMICQSAIDQVIARRSAQARNYSWFVRAGQEGVRIVPPFSVVPMFVEHPTRLEGRLLEPGTFVQVQLGAVCRNIPNGDNLVLNRSPNDHYAYGLRGTRHYCLGAHLASEVLIPQALGVLFRTMPWLEVYPSTFDRQPGMALRVLSAPAMFDQKEALRLLKL